MNRSLFLIRLLVGLGATLFFQPEFARAAEVPKGTRPNIYDESLDGTQQIANAIAEARSRAAFSDRSRNQRAMMQRNLA